MRTGGYTLQQSLTAEAATVVKQAVTLARRRGHAQVTPLHVASIMLASSVGLFKRACLQAHSHPLQCKALELCFNVALNRLPTTSTSSPIPILGSHHHHHNHHLQLPSLSNALIAAFKRAQAHQRRGSLENQQQPILALKVEIEQLVISILDDPSVSRVMREAGFSSTQVKSKVEQAVSVSSNSCSNSMAAETASASLVIAADASAANLKPPLTLPLPPSSSSFIMGNNYMPQTFKLSLERTRTTSHDQQVREDDVMSIVGAMMNNKKTKNTVIVGECPSTAESVVKGVIEKFDTGNVPGDMKNVQFISVPLFSLRNITREEFEMKLGELRSLVKSYISKGVVLYLGDLRWVSDFWSKYCEQRMNSLRSQYYKVYSPVEHMIMELSRLLCGNNNTNNNSKLWIMGIATLNTYMKCKTGRPSLETLWDLHPLTIPVGSLALSLNLDSCSELNNQPLGESKSKSWLLQYSCNKLGNACGGEDGDDDQEKEKYYYKYLNCCGDCLANFDKEVRGVTRNNNNNNSIHGTTSSSSLPSWLQQYKEEKQRETSQHHDQDFEMIKKDLCTKWNSICKSVHGNNVVPKCGSPMSPSSSASISSSSSTDRRRRRLLNNKLPLIFEKQQQPSNNYDVDYKEPKLFSHNYQEHDHQQYYNNKPEIKPELLSNPNSSPNSASSSEASGYDIDIDNDDTDLGEGGGGGRRLAAEEEEELICSALEKKVPWQKDIIRDIVRTVVKCRLINKPINKREDTWLCFIGSDFEGKDKIGRELAKAIFGNNNNFVAMGIRRRRRHVDSVDEEEVVIGSNKKRRRVDDDVEERGSSYLERFGGALRENPSRVFFLEDFDGIVEDDDNQTRKRFKKAMETGILDLSPSSPPVLLKDAIVIFNAEKRLAQMRNNGGGDDGDDRNRSQVITCLDLNLATEEEENEGGIMELMDKKMIFKINRN